MSSKTFSYDADQLLGLSLHQARSEASRNGYFIIPRDRENILNYSWLYEKWDKNVSKLPYFYKFVAVQQKKAS